MTRNFFLLYRLGERLYTVDRQTAGPPDQLQRGGDQGRHYPYRQWDGKKSLTQSPKDPKKTSDTTKCHVSSV